MDIDKGGLEMFFKPWQIEALRVLWNTDSALKSLDVWNAVGKDKISRASIINFLNDMVREGLLDADSETGKGGHHGVYTATYDEKGTKEYLVRIFKEKLDKLNQ